MSSQQGKAFVWPIAMVLAPCLLAVVFPASPLSPAFIFTDLLVLGIVGYGMRFCLEWPWLWHSEIKTGRARVLALLNTAQLLYAQSQSDPAYNDKEKDKAGQESQEHLEEVSLGEITLDGMGVEGFDSDRAHRNLAKLKRLESLSLFVCMALPIIGGYLLTISRDMIIIQEQRKSVVLSNLNLFAFFGLAFLRVVSQLSNAIYENTQQTSSLDLLLPETSLCNKAQSPTQIQLQKNLDSITTRLSNIELQFQSIVENNERDRKITSAELNYLGKSTKKMDKRIESLKVEFGRKYNDVSMKLQKTRSGIFMGPTIKQLSKTTGSYTSPIVTLPSKSGSLKNMEIPNGTSSPLSFKEKERSNSYNTYSGSRSTNAIIAGHIKSTNNNKFVSSVVYLFTSWFNLWVWCFKLSQDITLWFPKMVLRVSKSTILKIVEFRLNQLDDQSAESMSFQEILNGTPYTDNPNSENLIGENIEKE